MNRPTVFFLTFFCLVNTLFCSQEPTVSHMLSQALQAKVGSPLVLDQLQPATLSLPEEGVTLQSLDVDMEKRMFSARLEPQNPTHHPIHVKGTFSLQKEVGIIKRSTQRGASILPEDIYWQTVKESRKNRDAISRNTDLVGLRASQHLKAGEILTRHKINTSQDIPKGAGVTLLYRSRHMEIRAHGAKLSDKARIGEQVHVIPPYKQKTKHPLMGTLVDASTVLIQAR